MRRLVTMVGASAALLLMVTACGQRATGAGNQAPNASGATGQPPAATSTPVPPSTPAAPPGVTGAADPAGPKPPAGAVAVAAPQVDSKALPQNYPRTVWTVGDGRKVGAYGQEGGCSKVRAELTEETDQTVKITFIETVPAKSEICTDDLRAPALTVNLARPLAGRSVVLAEKDEVK